jgi:hypothetical protein
MANAATEIEYHYNNGGGLAQESNPLDRFSSAVYKMICCLSISVALNFDFHFIVSRIFCYSFTAYISISSVSESFAAWLSWKKPKGKQPYWSKRTKKVINGVDLGLMVKDQPDTFNPYHLAPDYLGVENKSQGDKINWFEIPDVLLLRFSYLTTYRWTVSRDSWTSARAVGWGICPRQRSMRRRGSLLPPWNDLVSHLLSSLHCNDGGKVESTSRGPLPCPQSRPAKASWT